MEYEESLLSHAFVTYKKELENAFHNQLSNPKDPKTSDKIRREGNNLFLQKSHSHELHEQILSLYNKSLALAPSGSSELASAYGNRSGFLLHIKKYGECIKDIHKALEITKSSELKVILLCRKVLCLKILGTDSQSLLREAQILVGRMLGNNKNKQKYNEMITLVANLSVYEETNKNQKKNKSVTLPVTDNLLNKVSIRHNEKYGRYLVAEQNYNPGDIIFVEKLFLFSVYFEHRYTNCHHCLKTCWSCIPCDYCEWAIFCSEYCYRRAWIEYHDIECSVGSLLNFVLSDLLWDQCSLSIKVFIKVIKDVGGNIESLRILLRNVDLCKDLCTKGFYKNEKFSNNTIESFYSLAKEKFLFEADEADISLITLTCVIGLLKHPELKNILSANKLEDLLLNRDFVFLGTVLIRFIAIEYNNSYSFTNFLNVWDAACGVSQVSRGCCMASLASLINHNCCPNANRCFTEDGNIIIYAVKPVKKNEQIFISYCKEYYSSHLRDRKTFLQDYNFECDCEACTKCWPVMLFKMVEDSSDVEFMSHCRNIVQAIIEKDYSIATLQKLVVKIILAFKYLKQPSTFTCVMLHALNTCVSNVYNGLKPRIFGKCKKM